MTVRQTFLAVAAIAMALVVAPVAQQGFTLEQVMSAPFPSDLTAAPRGGAFAWLQDDRGMRNIWVAEAPVYRGRQVTRYADDDGQELGGLAFTPDGRSIVFVRGGPPNRTSEIPNPTSDAAGTEQAVWAVSLDGGEPRKLGEGAAPAVSPRGDVVAFLLRGDVWSAALAEGGKAAKLFEARGTQGSLRWSPGGSRLAFVSTRGDHAFIGVYDAGEKRVRYLDPSVDRDSSPTWSPDGGRIAFIRQPVNKSTLPFMPRREGEPWSIRIVDVASGAGREAWRADAGRGSVFRGVVAASHLVWTPNGHVVFPWERTGWTHLYAIAAGGGPAAELTPGDFEVEHVTHAPGGDAIFYSSNQGDIDRRHVWTVAVPGGAPAAVTQGLGLEWSPAVAADGTVAFLAADARTPAHAEVIESGKGRRMLTIAMPTGFPSARLVEPEPVVFSASDGMPIHGQLFRPRDLAAGERRPAILFFHGGSRRQMLLGWHYNYYYHNAYAMNQYLAAQGYVVLSVNYRSGIGYGLEFREAVDYGADGASEYNDVTGAGLYLRSRADVDPDRIGLWGGSYGGYLTALGLARSSDLFKAGVDLHGVHDWNVVIRNFAQSYDPGAREALARRAFQSSPMASISTWRSPVLLIHGDDDRNVPFSETVDLVEALRKQGVPFEQLVFPDDVHDFLLHRHWIQAYRAAADFFDRMLRR